MSLLVDYRCEVCGTVSEQFVPSPIPAVTSCVNCGGSARRLYGGAGLMGVRLRKSARDRLDRERAARVPGAASPTHHDHDHGHGHGHSHDHGHGHDHGPAQTSGHDHGQGPGHGPDRPASSA